MLISRCRRQLWVGKTAATLAGACWAAGWRSCVTARVIAAHSDTMHSPGAPLAAAAAYRRAAFASGVTGEYESAAHRAPFVHPAAFDQQCAAPNRRLERDEFGGRGGGTQIQASSSPFPPDRASGDRGLVAMGISLAVGGCAPRVRCRPRQSDRRSRTSPYGI